jgi:hypothetical protein
MRRISLLLLLASLSAAGCWMRNEATLVDPNVRETVEQGVRAFKSHQYTAASGLFEQAVKSDSLNRSARYYLGCTYSRLMWDSTLADHDRRRDLVDKASRQFEAVLAIPPRDITEGLWMDPRTEITNVWGTLAALYAVWEDNEDSAIWAFKCGRERGGYYPAVLEFYRNTLASCDSNAILLTNGAMDPFVPWYLQLVEHFRTDVTVADPDMIRYHAIQDRCPFGLYPLPHALSDDQLDSLQPQPLRPRLLSLPAANDPENPAGKIEWMIRPSADDTVWTVNNQVLYEILKTNAWQRPVYFSVTLKERDLIGLKDWTTNEGLVFLLHSHAADSISLLRMSRNAFEVFTYDHLDDQETKDNKGMQRLKRYYCDHLALLMEGCERNGRKQEADRVLELMTEKNLITAKKILVSQPEPQERLPMREPRPDWEH